MIDHTLRVSSDSYTGQFLEADFGLTDVPTGNDFVAIAAGGFHNLALKSDGSLVGWGYNAHGQTNVPAGNDFVAIAAGGYHSLALKSDGSRVGWGANFAGQTSVPRGNNFIAIDAGDYHSLAIEAVPPPLTGDYDASGLVEQADLDLVLLNWGSELVNPSTAGWNNDLPQGPIDQMELDKVLLNWGATTALGAASVPEPASWALVGMALFAAASGRRRRRAGTTAAGTARPVG